MLWLSVLSDVATQPVQGYVAAIFVLLFQDFAHNHRSVFGFHYLAVELDCLLHVNVLEVANEMIYIMITKKIYIHFILLLNFTFHFHQFLFILSLKGNLISFTIQELINHKQLTFTIIFTNIIIPTILSIDIVHILVNFPVPVHKEARLVPHQFAIA